MANEARAIISGLSKTNSCGVAKRTFPSENNSICIANSGLGAEPFPFSCGNEFIGEPPVTVVFCAGGRAILSRLR